MNTLQLPARLVDKAHKEFMTEVSALILEEGVFVPYRVVRVRQVFELKRAADGVLVYSEKPVKTAKDTSRK